MTRRMITRRATHNTMIINWLLSSDLSLTRPPVPAASVVMSVIPVDDDVGDDDGGNVVLMTATGS